LPSMPDDDDIVNWDGILTPDERKRILARLRSALGSVGARIPDKETVGGREIPLRETVFDYLERESLSEHELEAVERLMDGLEDRVRDIEADIEVGDIDEKGAVALMKEVLGLLRALEHLRKLREPRKVGVAKAHIMRRIDDERRWLSFVNKIK